MLKVIPNALSPYLINRTIQQLEYYRPLMDVYDNPFESKLQLPKHIHEEYPFVDVLNHLLSDTTMALVSELLHHPLDRTVDDYHSAFFIYRQGDYLQYHLDAALHNLRFKVVTANLYFTSAEFVYQHSNVAIEPGMLVCFDNEDDAYHGVPITQKERMLVTVGYTGPKPPTILRTNKRAKFVPYPNETWPEDYWEAARVRAE